MQNVQNSFYVNLSLILVKSQVADKSNAAEWIIIGVNNCNLNLEKDPECLVSSNDDCSNDDCSNDDESQSPRRLHKSQDQSAPLHLKMLLWNNIVEMHLDSVFKDKSSMLSLELFQCVNVQVLSLKNNNLMRLPAEIGRLSQLRTLVLTDNYLTFNTIPYTLTFCVRLTELYLDSNILDALPGLLLDMPQLETVYRHGNHNYFKTTFMLYHTAERDRVMPLGTSRSNVKTEGSLFQPQSLQTLAVKSVIATKINFFSPGILPVTLQDYVAKIYKEYKICAFCSSAFHEPKTGFKVFTFKSPYVGNTWVPFEHWTCSRECGVAIEEPAHREERLQGKKLDTPYPLAAFIEAVPYLPQNSMALCVSLMSADQIQPCPGTCFPERRSVCGGAIRGVRLFSSLCPLDELNRCNGGDCTKLPLS